MTSEELEALEERVELMHKAQAPPDELAAMTLRVVEERIAHEHAHLACLHALRYEERWTDGQKIDLLARFTRQGMEAQAVILSHRWRLTKAFARRHHDLFRILFPKLPPHPNEKETPDEG